MAASAFLIVTAAQIQSKVSVMSFTPLLGVSPDPVVRIFAPPQT
jgi:hypothetical protein